MYDKAITISIRPDVAKHLTDREMRHSVKMQMVHSLITAGLEITDKTRFRYQIVTAPEAVNVSCRATLD